MTVLLFDWRIQPCFGIGYHVTKRSVVHDHINNFALSVRTCHVELGPFVNHSFIKYHYYQQQIIENINQTSKSIANCYKNSM